MLFGSLSNMFRSLTLSPAATAVDQARRQARRRLEAGGKAVPDPGSLADDNSAADFLLPPDADVLAVAKAVRRKLGIAEPVGANADALHPLERKLGGKVVLRGRHLLRLGDGRYELGRRFMHRIIGEIRTQRMRLARTY